eukprot:4936837-Prorocentrum_lima.AAC.1
MRRLLCIWSIILDKRAARDARVLQSSADVQSFNSYLDSLYDEHHKNVDTCTQGADYHDAQARANSLNCRV